VWKSADKKAWTFKIISVFPLKANEFSTVCYVENVENSERAKTLIFRFLN